MKKLIAVGLAALCACGTVALYSCSGLAGGEIMYSGDFGYCYINYSGDSRPRVNGDYVAIVELTTEGSEKETLIVPDEIDGKPVIQIGNMTGIGYSYSINYAGVWKWIYLPKNIQSCERFTSSELRTKKRLIMACNNLEYLHNVVRRPIYVSEDLYVEYQQEYQKSELNSLVKIADLQYISDGQVYFIADYDEGETIAYVPEAPEKEGYEFGGWYKEEECENEWNFEEDTFTLAEGQTVMKLYAKWI